MGDSAGRGNIHSLPILSFLLGHSPSSTSFMTSFGNPVTRGCFRSWRYLRLVSEEVCAQGIEELIRPGQGPWDVLGKRKVCGWGQVVRTAPTGIPAPAVSLDLRQSNLIRPGNLSQPWKGQGMCECVCWNRAQSPK